MDSVLIQNGLAHQVWRDTAKDEIPPLTQDLMNCIVEVASGSADEGDVWNGSAFSKPPAPVEPRVDGDVFLARVTDAEYGAVIAAAQSEVQLARWLDQVRILGYVNVTSEAAIVAKAAMVTAGLLTSERADVIFATA